jgi:hypothetical protein
MGSVLLILSLVLLFWWRRKRKQRAKSAATAARRRDIKLLIEETQDQCHLYELAVPIAELNGTEQFPELPGAVRQESIERVNQSEGQGNYRIGWI